MKTVISVKFRDAGKSYFFDPGELDIHEGAGVIVETSRGVEYGDVAMGPHEVEDSQIVGDLRGVIRVATPEDAQQREQNRRRERDAHGICMQKIEAHKLDMKLVDVEYAFNGAKIVFYFTADGRVDFRELVKDLASVFKTRIELRQIGVRDEAKLLGGLGSCGRPVCCKSFLADFQPVSIKMAKEQNLSLSPTKISGICGRLMCCLKYEQDCYETMRKQMPRVGRDVIAPDGVGVVLENNVITERTRVKLTLEDGTLDIRSYPFRELTLKNPPQPQNQAQKPKGDSPRRDGAKSRRRDADESGGAAKDDVAAAPESATRQTQAAVDPAAPVQSADARDDIAAAPESATREAASDE